MSDQVRLLQGDSLERLKELPDNSVDSVVTDPPYFLTNSGGSGFMGKEWDSLSVANALAESVLRSLVPVWLMAEESSADASANTNIKIQSSENNIHALYVKPACIGQPHSLSLGTFSVLESVLTKAEVLVLSSALCPSLTSVVASQPENVLYVVRNLLTENCPRSIALQVATLLHKVSVGADLSTLNSLMADQRTSAPTAEMTGNKSDSKFTSATISNVRSVESIVAEKRYSVTTSSLIESQKTIRWITSLRFVRNATALFTANPGNIQILSERFHYAWAKEVFRVLKPGGHILAFAGTRTYHPLANAIQGAGFEIRDCIQWIYGSGFPKSQDVSKAIDKQAGATREVVGTYDRYKDGKTRQDLGPVNNLYEHGLEGRNGYNLLTAPATPDGKRWQGWGTALKPANEPIVLARKPLEAKLTVAANVLKHGTGAINVDASRIASADAARKGNTTRSDCEQVAFGTGWQKSGTTPEAGRWPANVLFSESAAAALDEQSGDLGKSAGGNSRNVGNKVYGEYADGLDKKPCGFGDSGGASRFFYVAKASKRERNAGLEGMPEKETHRLGSGVGRTDGANSDNTRPAFDKNHHPTVKPIKLMEYLVRMVTPPGGVCLDPFLGSGSTGVAAVNLGFSFIGCEMSPEYLEIARKRIEHALEDE